MTSIRLSLAPWTLAVCKLPYGTLPAWAGASRFVSFTSAPGEISLVCEAHCVPPDIKAERDWACMKVDGVLDFSLVGIIAGITAVLAAETISVFVVSTFDTDYVLVKNDKIDTARRALSNAGYSFSAM